MAGGSRHRSCALVIATILAAPLAARAQVPGEEIARRTFEEGVTLEKRGDYEAALAKFRESRAIKPTLGNRFHAAYCLEMTGKLASALTEYESVDKAAREQNKQDVIEQTRARAEPLRARVPQLGLRLVPPVASGIEVLLDGALVAPALLDGKTFRADPGDHVVNARAPDHEPFTKELHLDGGGATTVDITLLPRAREAAPPPEPPRPAPTTADLRPVPNRTAAIVTTAGAALLAAGGLAAFLVAGSEQSDAEASCPTRVRCDDERDRIRTFDALALAGFAGAVGLGAVSVVLWSRGGHPVARIRPGPAWATIEGRF